MKIKLEKSLKIINLLSGIVFKNNFLINLRSWKKIEISIFY